MGRMKNKEVMLFDWPISLLAAFSAHCGQPATISISGPASRQQAALLVPAEKPCWAFLASQFKKIATSFSSSSFFFLSTRCCVRNIDILILQSALLTSLYELGRCSYVCVLSVLRDIMVTPTRLDL